MCSMIYLGPVHHSTLMLQERTFLVKLMVTLWATMWTGKWHEDQGWLSATLWAAGKGTAPWMEALAQACQRSALVHREAGRQQCTSRSSFSTERNGENSKYNQTKATEWMSFQQLSEEMGRAKICVCNLSNARCWTKVHIKFFWNERQDWKPFSTKQWRQWKPFLWF